MIWMAIPAALTVTSGYWFYREVKEAEKRPIEEIRDGMKKLIEGIF